MYKKFLPYREWIALQHSECKAEQSGNFNIKMEFIDRDLNISETKEIKLNVLKPWYLRTNIALPLYGGALILLLTTIYSLFKYLRKRRHVEYLKKKEIQRQYDEMEEEISGKVWW